MAMIAFRADDELKRQLEAIADNKGINLSALIKLYLKRAVKADLQETTLAGETVAEALQHTEKTEKIAVSTSGGTIYHSAQDLIALLEKEARNSNS